MFPTLRGDGLTLEEFGGNDGGRHDDVGLLHVQSVVFQGEDRAEGKYRVTGKLGVDVGVCCVKCLWLRKR